MATKIGLHTDAIAVIVLVFMLSLGMNLFQRYQYSDLLKEHADLQWQLQDVQINLSLTKHQLEKCSKPPVAH